MMTLTVVNAFNKGEKLTFECDPKVTPVKLLKQRIEERWGAPTDMQRLIYKSRALVDDN